jgi:hypothetical protein
MVVIKRDLPCFINSKLLPDIGNKNDREVLKYFAD